VAADCAQAAHASSTTTETTDRNVVAIRFMIHLFDVAENPVSRWRRCPRRQRLCPRTAPGHVGRPPAAREQGVAANRRNSAGALYINSSLERK
jgi:hypothetical protein